MQESTDWQTVPNGKGCVRCGGMRFLLTIGKKNVVECEKCGLEKESKMEEAK